MNYRPEKLRPHQLEYGTKGGAEAMIHATRVFINESCDENYQVLLKLDFRNAYSNCFKSSKIVRSCQRMYPRILPIRKHVLLFSPVATAGFEGE